MAGIFDEKTRQLCETWKERLTKSGNLELAHMLKEIATQQQESIQELANLSSGTPANSRLYTWSSLCM